MPHNKMLLLKYNNIAGIFIILFVKESENFTVVEFESSFCISSRFFKKMFLVDYMSFIYLLEVS